MKTKGSLYKSRHAGLLVKVRSGLSQRHPVTGDIIGETPSVWASFGEPTGTARFNNPLTGEWDELETFQGGLFDLDSAAEQNNWDDDVKEMVRRKLDNLCEKQPATCQRVDYVIEPAAKPWPTYDDLADIEEIALLAGSLGLTGKALAYERENLNRAALLDLLDEAAVASPDPEVAPEPVLAVKPKRVEEPLVPVAGIPSSVMTV